MREIKFRAWVSFDFEDDGETPKNFKMVEWNNIFFSDMSPVTGYGDEFPEPDSKYVKLMQYTGLKDKNGKEIYEGDTVKAVIYRDEEPQILTVEYIGTSFVINYKDSESDYFAISDFPGSVEVIGNIFENQELLKPAKSPITAKNESHK